MIAHAPISREVILSELKRMPLPAAALMCAPDYFDIVDVKNPYMEGQQGKVNVKLAKWQWREVQYAFERIGVRVSTLPALAGAEDMVFCANPVFTGLDGEGRRVCVLSHMRHASRDREVEAHAEWFARNGYHVVRLRGGGLFEGGGDAIWHPGRRLIWGGYGYRTEPDIYDEISAIFDAPVVPLELTSERFYHLDTCFCPLDEGTVLVNPAALTRESLDSIRRTVEYVIEADDGEAAKMACNGAPFFGKYVVIERGLTMTNRRLREHGFKVIEVETSEFLKSGGSVFCMKMHLF